LLPLAVVVVLLALTQPLVVELVVVDLEQELLL
jgi:hypothetical protein